MIFFNDCQVVPLTEDGIYPPAPDPVTKLWERMDRQAAEIITCQFDEVFMPSKDAIITAEEAAKAWGLDKVIPASTAMPIEPPYLSPEVFADYPQKVMVSDPLPPQTRETRLPRSRPRPAVAGPYDNAEGADVLDFQSDSYMRAVHNPDELLERASHFRTDIDKADTLVGTGLSGTLAVAELARKLEKRYLIVRKENDGSHSYHPVEGTLGKKWLFVDDLVGSGRTFARVWDTIEGLVEDRKFKTEFVGTFLYTDYEFVSPASSRTRRWLKNAERYDGRYGESLESSW